MTCTLVRPTAMEFFFSFKQLLYIHTHRAGRYIDIKHIDIYFKCDMELDAIAYIDIVQICTVILSPGKPLTRNSLHCSPHPSSFMHREGRGWNKHSGTVQQTFVAPHFGLDAP